MKPLFGLLLCHMTELKMSFDLSLGKPGIVPRDKPQIEA